MRYANVPAPVNSGLLNIDSIYIAIAANGNQ